MRCKERERAREWKEPKEYIHWRNIGGKESRMRERERESGGKKENNCHFLDNKLVDGEFTENGKLMRNETTTKQQRLDNRRECEENGIFKFIETCDRKSIFKVVYTSQPVCPIFFPLPRIQCGNYYVIVSMH